MAQLLVNISLHLIRILQFLSILQLRALIGEHKLCEKRIHIQVGILVQNNMLGIVYILQAVWRDLFEKHTPDILAAHAGKLIRII